MSWPSLRNSCAPVTFTIEFDAEPFWGSMWVFLSKLRVVFACTKFVQSAFCESNNMSPAGNPSCCFFASKMSFVMG